MINGPTLYRGRAEMRWVLPIPQQWIIALAIGVVTGVSAQSVPTSKPTAQAAVPDLRFGLIEPPVVAQKVIELRAPSPGIEMTSVGAKGLAAAGNRLMILSARHGNTIFASPLNFTTMRVPTIKGYPLIKDQFMEDPESLTLLPPQPGESLWTAFALGSMSNDALGQVRPRRMLLACAKLDPTVMSVKQTSVVSTEPIRRQLQGYFEKLGVEPYRTYHSEAKGEDKNTNRWGYVEGMSFVPNTTTLMCGMRNPLLREKALVFTVAGVIEACDKKDPALLRVTDLFTLDLGGRGISDLAWDGQTRGYLIAAARSAGPWLDPNLPFPPASLDSAIFWWSGDKSDAPRLIATAPDMRIEAICRLPETPWIAVGTEFPDKQSATVNQSPSITIMEFTGFQTGISDRGARK